MKPSSKDTGGERIEDALREWGRREPQTPAGIAARRVVARIESERRPTSVWRQPLLAAAGLAFVVMGVWVGGRIASGPSGPAPQALEEAPPPLPANVVQWWLDSETPVYFVTGPSESR